MEKRLHSLLLLLLFFAPPLFAQEKIAYQEDAEKKFQYALEFFEEGSFYAAAKHFQQLADAYPAHHRTTASYIMAARAHLAAKAPSRSLRLLEEFRLQFPGSSYLGESYLISGEASAAADSPARAIEYYLRAWKAGVQNYDRFAWLIHQLGSVTLSPYDRKVTENVLKTLDDAEKLRALLPLDGTATPKSATAGRAAGVSSSTVTPQSTVIAVALPGKVGDRQKQHLVEQLKRGMRLALDEHNASSDFKAEMLLLDSGDPAKLREECDRLEQDPRAVIMLAGAFSSDARTVCEILGERELLVLLPTATDAELTEYGRNIFQMNTPIEDRARLLADFAFLELDAEAVCVLAPDESYPREMADAFVQRCRELGLPVEGLAHYRTAERNLSEACGQLARSDRAKNAVLFAPVSSPKHIGSVLEGAGQVQNVRTILGGGNWNYPKVLKRHASNITIYFESDVLPEKGQRKMRSLLHRDREREQSGISREMLFGFDAMKLALHVAGSEPTTREAARRKLRDVFEGLRAPVNFVDSRVNRAMNMLRCFKGNIELLESFYAK